MTALPNRDRRAERRAATRLEILDAAWQIARREGLSAVTLRGVGAIVGMRPPSLYSHFDSKNAIYDGMFAQAWSAARIALEAVEVDPKQPRRSLLAAAEAYFDFSVADVARYQLMSQAVLPTFAPSPEAYAESERTFDLMVTRMRRIGVRAAADLDVWTALLSGAISQQLANDIGGTRWRRQLPRLVDMYADGIGLSGPKLRRTR
jgi:AcrR family transcriptional regulator